MSGKHDAMARLSQPEFRCRDYTALLRAILSADPVRCRVLGAVAALHLPDCWIAAGFVRAAVWDHLHGFAASGPAGDVDVIWFDPARAVATEDRDLEAALRELEPSVEWSVKNQARMHLRNGDAPYASAVDAMRWWPETATAVAVRQVGPGQLEVAAPFGLADLCGLVVRPTPGFSGPKRAVCLQRVASKQWLERWPLLRVQA